MGDKTGISWSDATWNAVTGCDRISEGCDRCYALTLAARLKRMGSANYQRDGNPRTSGPGFGVTEHEHMLDQPIRWRRPRRIFVNSMSDMFHTEVTPFFIARMFAVMAVCPQHEFQILTKRPQRMLKVLTDDTWLNFRATETAHMAREVKVPVDDLRPFEWPLANVVLGVTIESDRFTWRADYLRETPAARRFISAEPLLGPLPSLDLTGIDWLIVGSESGRGARPMDLAWVRELRDMCIETCRCGHERGVHALVPGGDCWVKDCPCESFGGATFFVKQISDGTAHAVKDIEAFPVDLRIRQPVRA